MSFISAIRAQVHAANQLPKHLQPIVLLVLLMLLLNFVVFIAPLKIAE
jgi:hypothetical protein